MSKQSCEMSKSQTKFYPTKSAYIETILAPKFNKTEQIFPNEAWFHKTECSPELVNPTCQYLLHEYIHDISQLCDKASIILKSISSKKQI